MVIFVWLSTYHESLPLCFVRITKLEAFVWICGVCKVWKHVIQKYSPRTQGDEKWDR